MAGSTSINKPAESRRSDMGRRSGWPEMSKNGAASTNVKEREAAFVMGDGASQDQDVACPFLSVISETRSDDILFEAAQHVVESTVTIGWQKCRPSLEIGQSAIRASTRGCLRHPPVECMIVCLLLGAPPSSVARMHRVKCSRRGRRRSQGFRELDQSK